MTCLVCASMLAPVRDIATISKMSPNLYVRKIEERNVKLQIYIKCLEAKLDEVLPHNPCLHGIHRPHI